MRRGVLCATLTPIAALGLMDWGGTFLTLNPSSTWSQDVYHQQQERKARDEKETISLGIDAHFEHVERGRLHAVHA
jgi:hypothetical protein